MFGYHFKTDCRTFHTVDQDAANYLTSLEFLTENIENWALHPFSSSSLLHNQITNIIMFSNHLIQSQFQYKSFLEKLSNIGSVVVQLKKVLPIWKNNSIDLSALNAWWRIILRHGIQAFKGVIWRSKFELLYFIASFFAHDPRNVCNKFQRN